MIDSDLPVGGDVARSEQTVPLDAAKFETVREHVAAGRDRWVGAIVRDGNGRVPLVRNRWSDGWVVPGGTVELDETLREAVVREVREETGLDATVERPLEVVEQTFTDGDRSVRGAFVVFEATADDRQLGTDLGVDDGEIAAAAWFEEIPAECENRDVLTRHF